MIPRINNSSSISFKGSMMTAPGKSENSAPVSVREGYQKQVLENNKIAQTMSEQAMAPSGAGNKMDIKI